MPNELNVQQHLVCLLATELPAAIVFTHLRDFFKGDPKLYGKVAFAVTPGTQKTPEVSNTFRDVCGRWNSTISSWTLKTTKPKLKCLIKTQWKQNNNIIDKDSIEKYWENIASSWKLYWCKNGNQVFSVLHFCWILCSSTLKTHMHMN